MKEINFNDLLMDNYRPVDDDLLCPACREEIDFISSGTNKWICDKCGKVFHTEFVQINFVKLEDWD